MIGQTLTHYRITAKLGAGGMGEVYRATDSKLGREVAIKVLPAHLMQSRESVVRFEREAKALATFNHPNIAAIYGFDAAAETHFLVMELVEGETLDERLKRGRLPIDEALDIGRQIAEALEAAHEKGIIHRDLKPANVKITPDGKVKVLDFGLAKAMGEGPSTTSVNAVLEDSPTLIASLHPTMPGLILGTAAYMSPEQARGKVVDKRSDIWSFGVVMFECITGQRLFTGESVSDILAAVLKSEIDWKLLPPESPAPIQWLLRKCLTRDKKLRLQDVGDARVDLDRSIADPNWGKELRPISEAHWRPSVNRAAICAGSILIAVVSLALGWFLNRPVPTLTPARHLALALPSDVDIRDVPGCAFALSPDGQQLAFISGHIMEGDLRLLAFDTGAYRILPNSRSGYHPFFSPDGRSLGFVTPDSLRIISLTGGHGVTLTRVARSRGASWGKNGDIVYAPNPSSGLLKISSTGGKSEILTKLENGEKSHRWPQFLDDGQHVIFLAVSSAQDSAEVGNIEVVSVTSGKRRVLKEGCAYPRYASSGHLLFVSDRTFYASRFDSKNLRMIGSPVPILSKVATTARGGAQYDVAADGTLVYMDHLPSVRNRNLIWLDRDGKWTNAVERTDTFDNYFRLSPDEKRVVMRRENQNYVLDLERNLLRRLTFRDVYHTGAVWSPDGQWLVYGSPQEGKMGVWRRRSDWAGEEELLFASDNLETAFPSGFSTDGKSILGQSQLTDGKYGAWVYSIGEDAPEYFMRSANIIGSPQMSPDGKWFAYFSDESGRAEIYARRFDGTGGVQQISTGGGAAPQWSKDGEQLFFYSQSRIMSVPIRRNGDLLEPGIPTKVADLPASSGANAWQMGVDNKRLLLLAPNPSEAGTNAASPSTATLKIILNWFTDLNQKLPPRRR